MVRPFPNHVTDHFQSAPLAIGLFVSVFALVALCAKHKTKSPKGTITNEYNDLYDDKSSNGVPENHHNVSKSAMSTPKRLMASISNISIRSNKKNKDQKEDEEMIEEAKDTFGEGGLWQKNILMGEKCQPLEYSGVIYYDNNGNRTDIPRSPRISSVINQQGGSFSLPASSPSSIESDTSLFGGTETQYHQVE